MVCRTCSNDHGWTARHAVLTFLSGILYQHHGAEAFWLMSLLCLVAIPVALSLGRPGRSFGDDPNAAVTDDDAPGPASGLMKREGSR